MRIRRHIITHTFVDGMPLQFTGTGGQYLGVALVNLILTTITASIYALLGFATVREVRWDAANTIIPVLAGMGAPVSAAGNQPIQVTVNVNR